MMTVALAALPLGWLICRLAPSFPAGKAIAVYAFDGLYSHGGEVSGAMNLEIERESPVPIYLQIKSQVKGQILSGELLDGSPMPSERMLAEQLGIHRNTVTRAYGELKAEGLLQSSQGKGYRASVRSHKNTIAALRPVNWGALTQNSYADTESSFVLQFAKSFDDGIISFAGGIAAREPYPSEETARIIEKILRTNREKAYFFASIQGDEDLRRNLVKFVSRKGIKADSSNIQVFSDNNQALHFILSMFLHPGDSVIVDELSSPDVPRSVELAGGHVVRVPSDDEGMVCATMAGIIEEEAPAFIYVEAGYSNPTGTALSTARKKELLDLSYRYGIPIIEADETSELFLDGAPLPTIKSMDTGDNVIYLHSFALSMIPGIGVSFVVANQGMINNLCNMTMLHIVNSDWAAQMVTVEHLASGKLYERLAEFRAIYREKRDLMCARLDELAERYPLGYVKPDGGVYIWVELPRRVSAKSLLAKARRRGVTFMTGESFFEEPSRGRSHIRLNYSYPSLDEIDRGMEALGLALGEALEG